MYHTGPYGITNIEGGSAQSNDTKGVSSNPMKEMNQRPQKPNGARSMEVNKLLFHLCYVSSDIAKKENWIFHLFTVN